jgi:imidazolonepropionase-like amidohydrolase
MRRVYTQANVFNGEGFTLTSVEVDHGKITRVGGDKPAGVPQVNLGGRYLVPGLIDAHAHLVLSTDSPREEGALPRAIKSTRNAQIQLRSSVTAVRDAGGPSRINIELALAVQAGIVPGPRIKACGTFLSITGGHVSYWSREADGEDDVRRAVREQLKEGAHYIKIMASGGVADGSENPERAQFSRKELDAIVEEATQGQTYVAAHAHPARAIRDCLLSGVRTIEHASFIDQECVELALQKEAYIVPTFIVYQVIAQSGKTPAAQRDLSQRVLEQKGQRFLEAIRQGVRWGVGTDAGSFMPQGCLWQEMELIRQLGVAASEVLWAATWGNAQLIQEPMLGKVEPGFHADFVVLDSNPLEDFAVFAQPRWVFKAGMPVYEHPASPPILAV